MRRPTSILIPTLVRIKPGALDRIGIYAKRFELNKIIILFSAGLSSPLLQRFDEAMKGNGIEVLQRFEVKSPDSKQADEISRSLASGTDAIIGFGGGKALDVAKYVACLSHRPYIAVPTSLSNDGFCSPQSSLLFDGQRRSVSSGMPFGVVIDTQISLQAPIQLWLSGIGDMVAKITSIYDWKLAARKKSVSINDFSALLSDATVFQLLAKPDHDLEGMRLLGTALMMNGIAMEICGSSRPASGSEHLISHALDQISRTPRLHGFQVGIAAYIVSQFQKQGTNKIAKLFEATGFWNEIKKEPFSKEEWLEALRIAPTVKTDYYTILSEKNWSRDFVHILNEDPHLERIFK